MQFVYAPRRREAGRRNRAWSKSGVLSSPRCAQGMPRPRDRSMLMRAHLASVHRMLQRSSEASTTATRLTDGAGCEATMTHTPCRPSPPHRAATPSPASACSTSRSWSPGRTGPPARRPGRRRDQVEPPEGDESPARAPARRRERLLRPAQRRQAEPRARPEAAGGARARAAARRVGDVLIENFRPGVMARLGLGQRGAAAPTRASSTARSRLRPGAGGRAAAYATMSTPPAASTHARALRRRRRPAGAERDLRRRRLGAIFAYGAIQTALLQRERTGDGQPSTSR